MLSDDARTLISTWPMGLVATTNPDGTPNLSPKGTFVVHDDRTLGFAAIRSPGTLANLAERPALEVNFIDILTRRALRVSGTGRIVTRRPEVFAEVSVPYFSRWPDLADRMHGIVLIDISHATLITTPAYDVGAKMQDLSALWMDLVAQAHDANMAQDAETC